ncbi:MAG: sodium/hydrogen antiporter [Thermoleophilaceae bacterium]|jgi:NhaP-type Na+/H+ or K+/H+ antiporter|nr:sodium/hydrogen antiporter [Thermoleophilaceae bacterium]
MTGVLAATTFDRVALVLGGMLVLGALISGLARRSFLSLTAVFVLGGFALGKGGLDVLSFDPRSGFVGGLALVALIVILFRDGLEVEAEMLQTAWRLPFRKLVLAMPITAGLVACLTKALTDLSWTEAFLVGALLSPTDPVLSSSVVTNPRVPRLVRHSLNLESGLNDGLALPAVVALVAALKVDGGDFNWWRFVLEDVSIGLGVGVAVGFLASRLMPVSRALGHEVSAHQKSLFALGVAFAAYGAAVLPPHGNGLIATFVCAIVLGILRPDIRASFETQAEDLVEVVKLGIFVVFGSLLTLGGLLDDGLAAVGIAAFVLLVARPVAVFIALARTRTDTATRAFMAWFGPKGVATMTFALLVLSSHIARGTRIFNLAALAVVISIVAHGVTDTAGSEWMARRAERSG